MELTPTRTESPQLKGACRLKFRERSGCSIVTSETTSDSRAVARMTFKTGFHVCGITRTLFFEVLLFINRPEVGWHADNLLMARQANRFVFGYEQVNC